MLKLPNKYYVLDFETNGLPKNNDVSNVDIIEIGYILFEESETKKLVQSLAKPEILPLSAKIIEITGIKDDDLTNADSSCEVFEKTSKELVYSDLPVIGHNIIKFDKLFCDKYCDMLKWPRIDNKRYIDTAALFKEIRKSHRTKAKLNLPQSQQHFFYWAQNILEHSWSEDQIKFNLDAMTGYLGVSQFGIEHERHRVLHDIILTQRGFEAIKELLI